MNIWMDLKRALTLIDVVTRKWGKELGLDECGVMVLALLGEGGRSPECELAAKCGRARPQVHRALRVLEDRQYACRIVVEEQTRGWELTERGRRLWRCLDRGIRAFEAELEERIDVDALKGALERVVAIFLNRPGSRTGWRFGLSVPLALRQMPIGVEASWEGLLGGEPESAAAAAEPQRAEPAIEEPLPTPPGSWPKPWTAAEREFIKFYWELVAEREAEEKGVRPGGAEARDG